MRWIDIIHRDNGLWSVESWYSCVFEVLRFGQLVFL